MYELLFLGIPLTETKLDWQNTDWYLIIILMRKDFSKK